MIPGACGTASPAASPGRPDADPRRAELLERLHTDSRAVSAYAARRGMDSVMSLPLTIQQLKVLMLVVTAGAVTAHRVADELGLTAATVSGIVDRLVERDLVVRDHDATDRRVRPLRATPAGTAIIESLTEIGAWHEQEALALLGTDDLAALVQGIGALRRAVETIEARDAGA